jgi:hypothetical protein
MKARGLIVAALLLAAACREADSVILVNVAAGGTAGVRQLRAKLTNANATDVLSFPDVPASTDVTFPASFAIVVDRGRSGAVMLSIDAVSATGAVIAGATASATIAVGGTTTVNATLQPVGGGEPATTTCADYCGRLAESCGESFAKVFADSQPSCVKLCSALAWPAGAANDSTGNTLACRMSNATRALAEPTSCEPASYTGGNVCGSLCEVYCFMQDQICTKAGLPQFPDAATCMTACATYDARGAFHAASGNTLQCRLYHLTAAALQDVATHCPHTGALPTRFCM